LLGISFHQWQEGGHLLAERDRRTPDGRGSEPKDRVNDTDNFRHFPHGLTRLGKIQEVRYQSIQSSTFFLNDA